MLYIAGITEGKNLPSGRKFDLSDCKNLIIVDTKYYLDHVQEINQFAKKFSSD